VERGKGGKGSTALSEDPIHLQSLFKENIFKNVKNCERSLTGKREISIKKRKKKTS
jgi:hypothetical protein